MRRPVISKPDDRGARGDDERGVTMVLVALAMIAVIGMAALSIDVITLYLAKEEAQRSADAGALAAARIISVSGITGTDPDTDAAEWRKICGGMSATASVTAKAVAQQNAVGSSAPTVSVKYSVSGSSVGSTDCSALPDAFAINPTVIVQVTSGNLPALFSRIWSRSTHTVSATAVAEAFNPSKSGSVATNGIVPVNPRCVKPLIVPNRDPNNSGAPFVRVVDGSIRHPGIQLAPGTGTGAVVGETFTLMSDCKTGNPNCNGGLADNPPSFNNQAANTLDYVPALVQGTPSAFTSCANDNDYQEAIGGCDSNTVYACGTVGGGAQADLTFNPGKPNGDTSEATQCLIHQSGQDVLDTSVFPFRIQAGSSNPVLTSGFVSSSSSIVTVPIYDDTQAPGSLVGTQPSVTIVGFLQLFINNVDNKGDVNVTVLNVAGCSNTATAPPAAGSSPVPIRLITSQ